MKMIAILTLFSINAYIECSSSALFCTHNKDDYEVNRLQSIFTFKDKVYIRVGTKASKYWIYDVKQEEVLVNPVMATQIFPDYHPIVEFMSAVYCDNCPPEAANLVIAIGRKDLNAYKTFATFRIQSNGALVKIKGRNELPQSWGLRDGEGEFSLNAVPFWGFFPENVVTVKTNFSNIHGLSFFPSAQIFHLKYTNEKEKFLLYKRLNPNGNLTDWKVMTIKGDFYILNSLFYINDTIYSINNDPQYMPRIAHKITVREENGELVFNSTILDIEARDFFNCYDKPTTLPTPSTTVIPAITTSIVTTVKSSSASTALSVSSEVITTSTKTIITSESMTTSADTNTNSLATISSTEPNTTDDGNENIIFWIIFIALIFIIIIIAMICVFVFIYMRNKQKSGNYYFTESKKLSEKSGFDGQSKKRPIILGDSPSSVSVRSTHDQKQTTDIRKMNLNGRSPSSASIRSYQN